MSTRMSLFLSVAFLVITFNSTYAQNLQNGGHVFFFFGEREYYELYNMYSMQVWVYVPPGHRWKVGSSIINIEYNENALRIITSDTVWDAWPELKSKGYIVRQSDYGTAASLSLSLFSSNYAVIEEGQAIHLGTLRWEVLDGSQADGFYMSSDSTDPSASVILDSTFQLKPKRSQFNARWTWSTISPRIIDPSTVSCSPSYYRTPDSTCLEVWPVIAETPLQDSCLYWHRIATPTGVGPHTISYQVDWSDAPIGTDRIQHFLTQSLDSIFAAVRCRWEKQLAPGDLEWKELPDNKINGGVIRWSRVMSEFDEVFGATFIAKTYSALHPNDLTKIVAAAECGDGGVRFGMSTILLNNSTEFYVANPHFRWTTDYHTCGYSPRCLDMESILLHEAGHYIGIGHQEQPLSVVWSGYDGVNIHIHQCDADAARRLYSPQLLAQTPVPPPDNQPCAAVTGVEEHPPTDVAIGDAVQIYPMPITDGQFSIRVHIQTPTRVALSILDVMGRTVQMLSDTYQVPGEQHYTFNIDLVAGTYFLRLQTDTSSHIEKIVVLR